MGGTESSTFLPALTNTTHHTNSTTKQICKHSPCHTQEEKRSANQNCKSTAVGRVRGKECETVKKPFTVRVCTCERIKLAFCKALVVGLCLSPLFLLLPSFSSFCLSLFLRFCAWVVAANSLRIALQLCLCVSERGSEREGR